jgi:predicted metal-dependent HD superfamily phosphohydrolase
MNESKKFFARAHDHFLELMISSGTPLGGLYLIFNDLFCSYSEFHRAYHTLEHIVAMLDEFEMVSSSADDPDAIRFAIWYHDVVYDVKVGKSDLSNEEKSALRAEADLLKLEIPKKRIEAVCQMIRVTGHQDGVTPLSSDEQLLLDLDLAILGKDRDTFAKYQSGIRYEYAHVPEDVYRAARNKILSRFFERSPLYLTPFFREKYEDAAKQNLSRVLNVPYMPTTK